MGVARLKSGKLKRVITRARDGRELSRFDPSALSHHPAPVPRPPLPEPTMKDMLANASNALAKWTKAGFPIADRKLRIARLVKCEVCPHWERTARAGLGKCNHPKCGCTKAKVFLKTERCPIGKW